MPAPVPIPVPVPVPNAQEAVNTELEGLGAPTRLYLAHEQPVPRGFVGFGSVQRAFEWSRAKMLAFDFADPAFGACGERVVNRDGTICASAVYPGSELSTEQASRVLELSREALRASTRQHTRCFEPHHAIVYFDQKGVPVAEVTVCFECSAIRLSPGPSASRSMSAEEARFFVDLCQTSGAGGCPTLLANGELRGPHFSLPALSYEEYQSFAVQRALQRDHGLDKHERVTALTAHERLRLCSWLDSVSRFASRTLGCVDGRNIITHSQSECTATPRAGCSATVDDFAACAKSRFAPVCGQDSPSCSASDACRWGMIMTRHAE